MTFFFFFCCNYRNSSGSEPNSCIFLSHVNCSSTCTDVLYYQTPSFKALSHTKGCLPVTSLHVPGPVFTPREQTKQKVSIPKCRESWCAGLLGKVIWPMKKQCRRQPRKGDVVTRFLVGEEMSNASPVMFYP